MIPPLSLSDSAAAAVQSGHPWVYREAIRSLPAHLAPGDIVALHHAGKFMARAMLDPTSPLLARILTRNPGEPIDDAFLTKRLLAAAQRRQTWVASPETDAYRLCYGEGDGLPGIVIDQYAHVAVVRTDGAAAAKWVNKSHRVLGRALEEIGVRSIVLRLSADQPSPIRGKKIRPLSGEPAPDIVTVREHGMVMEVDVARGQKTGAFLDQRENRRRLRTWAEGRRVLNLFSYAGGFSLAAALGGATHVTSVDVAAQGHASAGRSFRANRLDSNLHTFVTADCFAFLEGAKQRGERWDIVVSDPPSFAPSEAAKARALEGYSRLHRACVDVLAPGGIFCASSCSSHVAAEEFLSTIDGGKTPLHLGDLFGLPPDHPTLPAWREGRYLKFARLMAG